MGSLVSSSFETFANENIFKVPNTPRKQFESLNTSTPHFRSELLVTPERISMVYIEPKKRRSKKVILFSHGTSSDLTTIKDYLFSIVEDFGCRVVCYDYIGYGLTKGVSSEDNCYRSLDSVVNYLLDTFDVDQDDIIFVGHSLGTGVTIGYLYLNPDFERNPIILIAPYKSIGKIVADCSPSLLDEVDKLVTYKKISSILNPIKIYHGTADKTIPISHGEYLFEYSANPEPPVWVKGAGHVDILKNVDYSLVL